MFEFVVQGQLSYYVSQQQLLSQRATEAETHKLHLTHFFPQFFLIHLTI